MFTVEANATPIAIVVYMVVFPTWVVARIVFAIISTTIVNAFFIPLLCILHYRLYWIQSEQKKLKSNHHSSSIRESREIEMANRQ